MRRLLILTFAIFAPALTQAMAAQSGGSVTATADELARYGVKTIQLAMREEQEGVYAIIRAADTGALFLLDADLDAATAAASASEDELRRLEKLARQDQSASQKSVQAARQQATADAAKLKLLHRRLIIEWGPQFDALSAEEFSALTASIGQGDAALVRADAPARPAGVIGEVAINISQGAPPIIATPIGLSGSVDARMQTIGLFAVVRGDAASLLRAGRTFSGEIMTPETTTGVVIPRAAIVRIDGAAWAYVKTGDDVFERREIVNSRPITDGWFVVDGFAPGDIIAEAGVGALVAIERGDESAETD